MRSKSFAIFGILFPVALAMLAGVLSMASGRIALVEFTTSIVDRTPAQKHNITKAAVALNGAIVLSNEVFSFNNAIGKCDAEKGYVPAPTLVKGELVDNMGGGICQVSSTLYNAVLLAGMEIVERHPHSVPVSSVSPGRDATVLYGASDLRFKNNLPKPLTIETSVGGGKLSIRLLSRSKPDKKYKLIIDMNDRIRPVASYSGSVNTRYRDAVLWREHIVDGKSVSKEMISSDVYKTIPK